MTTDATIEQLSAAAEHRGGVVARRADGAFFTAGDVAAWLARRAIDALMKDVLETHSHTDARARLASLRVLDPTCGAGAFLVAAWHELRRWEVELDARAGDASGPRVMARQLCGVDRDGNAVNATISIVEAVAGPGADIVHADAFDALPGMGGFDVVLGNPPYVRALVADAPPGLRSAAAGNLAAWIVELALAACAPGGRIAMVLPVSVASSPKWRGLRSAWSDACADAWAAHFDTIPSTLFPDVVQRLTLLEGTTGAGPARWRTTTYHRWLGRERDGLLERVRHVPIDFTAAEDFLPKLGSPAEVELWANLHQHPQLGRWFARDERTNVVHYKRRWSYFLLFADFVPPIWDAKGNERMPSELQSLGIDARVDSRAVVALLSSTLLWWWFSVRTDNRNVNRGELAAFPVPELSATDIERLSELGCELMHALHDCGEVRTCTYKSVGTIRNTYYRQAATRPVLDEIDAELARCYGMTGEQLQMVLDYERRFRS